MRKSKSVVLWNACFILVSASPVALAQGSPTKASAAPAPTIGPGARGELKGVMEDAEKKLTRLAEAIPAEKFSWRPTKDVRSVSEVLLHVAAGNYGLTRRVGIDPPADFKPQGFDKSTTDKTKVIEALKKSFAHAKQATTTLTEADLEKTTKGFDNSQVTYRLILMALAAHQHEHLGQLIAYTRTMGITPPWTEEREKAQQQKPKT